MKTPKPSPPIPSYSSVSPHNLRSSFPNVKPEKKMGDEDANLHHHPITIDEELELMNTQMKKSPKLLNKSAAKDSCCIFRVPPSLMEINKEAYRPRIVSIGPYHYGNQDLEMVQEHKWRLLNDMITRTGRTLKFFLDMMVSMEFEVRESYSESTDHLSSSDLAKMMVLDGVFIIELLRKVGKMVAVHPDDPLFRMPWMSPFLMRDLLRLENQIPFFVLQRLFHESKTVSVSVPDRPLPCLILDFFNYAVDRPANVLEKYRNLEGKHLLDFFRKSFIKNQMREPIPFKGKAGTEPTLKLINPATKLQVAGVRFRANLVADSFLDVDFQGGVLWIPPINMDDFYSSFFLNCVAFEQCYCYCLNDITTYVLFMGRLANTSADAGLLSEKKIIENYCGTNKDIVKFFNDVGKDVAFDIKNSYLLGLFVEVNKHCKNGWHVGWAGFKHTYFESPWAFISALAAFLLLSLAFMQTFYTIYPYYHKRD